MDAPQNTTDLLAVAALAATVSVLGTIATLGKLYATKTAGERSPARATERRKLLASCGSLMAARKSALLVEGMHCGMDGDQSAGLALIIKN